MTMMEDTMKSAQKVMDETRDGAGHVAERGRSALLEGLHAAASTMTMLRGLGLADALGWVGLQRRRSPLVPMVTFGAGFVAGAAVGVLFAPMSGNDTRRMMVQRAMGLENVAEHKASEVKNHLEGTANELAGKAKDALHKAQDTAAHGASTARAAVGGTLGDAGAALTDAGNAIKHGDAGKSKPVAGSHTS